MASWLENLNLSGREERVLTLAAAGMQDKEIARELEISLTTLRTYWDRIRTKAGNLNRVELVAALIRDATLSETEAQVRETQRLAHEVAKRRNAEILFRSMARSSPMGIYVRSAQGSITYVNPAFVEITGAPLSEVTEQGWKRYIHPEDLLALDAVVERAGETGERLDIDVRVVRPDGRVRWVRLLSAPMLYEGQELGRVGLLADISEQKELERRLADSEAQLTAFMDKSPTVNCVKDEEGRYVFVSAHFEEAFGISREQVLGRTNFDWMPPDLAEVARDNDRRVFETEEPITTMELLPVSGGREPWIVHKFPFRLGSGERRIGITAIGLQQIENLALFHR